MYAIVFDRFGGPDVLELRERRLPEPGPGQVRVVVRAAGVNPFDAKVRSGAMEQVFRTALPSTPGGDVAGVVDAVGQGVENLRRGDEVFGWADTGSYAEYALATRAAPKPAVLDWAAAAALPTSGEAALRGLDLLEVGGADTVLVNGAAGGVGSFAVQLAARRGATVLGTASDGNHEFLRQLGAIPVAYGSGLVDRVRAAAPRGVDAVFDVAGRGGLPDAIELRGGTNRIVTIADPAADALGVRVSYGTAQDQTVDVLEQLAGRASKGDLLVEIAATFPLAAAVQAHELLETGHVRGKVVLLP